MEKSKRKVIAYVDGFNLYFGMVEAGFDDLKWLNIRQLIESFLSADQELITIKYFTSSISNDAPKEKRQRTYIDALENTGIRVTRGLYERKEVICKKCTHTWLRTNEKMTDVNIATTMIIDAMENAFDVAILISGDSDLVPAIKIVHTKFHPKSISVFFPPKRKNISVRDAANGSLDLGRKKLKDCQFPDEIILKSGFTITKPKDWP